MSINLLVSCVLIVTIILAYICIRQMDPFYSSYDNIPSSLMPINDRLKTGYQMMNDYRFKMMDNQYRIDKLSDRVNKLLGNINKLSTSKKSNTTNELVFY